MIKFASFLKIRVKCTKLICWDKFHKLYKVGRKNGIKPKKYNICLFINKKNYNKTLWDGCEFLVFKYKFLYQMCLKKIELK